ncbi:helix-turn-helix domain-containing protein [Pectinatus brassicae]|uniref:AraC-like DNA-binding protein n=1 Tax=Pectinatus brassicae TaxID=862415 RepID=A0A840UD06_9FIRM|nr:AraC family transcriptional regulator [Pectinatus brassicae]MBB5334956.1 AraC-like DNA-binding protein [Pectinatus brassicae]
MYIIFECPPLPYLIVGGISLYRKGDSHLRRIMPHTFDVIYVKSGRLYMEEDRNRFIVEKNQYLILPPQRLHKGYKCCDSETDFYWLHFYTTGDFFFAQQPLYNRNAPQKANYQFTKEPFHISIAQYGDVNKENSGELEKCLDKIVQVRIDKNIHRKNFYASAVSQIKNQQLFFTILTLLCDTERLVNKKNTAENIFDYLQLHYREAFDLKKLADIFSFHPGHIIRCVKKQYGITPLQLFLHLRIEKAQQLLQENKMPIETIAEQIGFNDKAYFSKQFKKIVGTTPSDYRKKFFSSN